MIKKKKIGGISFQIQDHKKGLQFFPNKPDDIEAAKDMGMKKLVATIQRHLDSQFNGGDFKHDGGASVNGMVFIYKPGSLIDRV